MTLSRPAESTATLLVCACNGDEYARGKLVARYANVLRRWARGRLSGAARDMLDTDDLVQCTLYRGFSRLEHFELRGEEAFLAYLRQILLNQIRDEARRARRRPRREELGENLAIQEPSPLERLIQRERVELYERSLTKLTAAQRQAVILRVELGLRYRAIATAMGVPSANAARALVARALVRLTKVVRAYVREPGTGRSGERESRARKENGADESRLGRREAP